MTKLKLGPLTDDKPIRITVELPAQVHRDLIAYAEVLGRETGAAQSVEVTKLIAPMLARFMSTDRVFAKALREKVSGASTAPDRNFNPHRNEPPGEHG